MVLCRGESRCRSGFKFSCHFTSYFIVISTARKLNEAIVDLAAHHNVKLDGDESSGEDKAIDSFVGSKKISQETFDSVVQENIDDFEMEEEEAIQDAIMQFKEQGVDLSNIVTRRKSEFEGVSEIIGRLQAARDDKSPPGVLAVILLELLAECEKDDMNIIVARQDGAFGAVAGLFLDFGDVPDVLCPAFRAFSILFSGPDAPRHPLPTPTVNALYTCLDAHYDKEEVQVYIIVTICSLVFN